MAKVSSRASHQLTSHLISASFFMHAHLIVGTYCGLKVCGWVSTPIPSQLHSSWLQEALLGSIAPIARSLSQNHPHIFLALCFSQVSSSKYVLHQFLLPLLSSTQNICLLSCSHHFCHHVSSLYPIMFILFPLLSETQASFLRSSLLLSFFGLWIVTRLSCTLWLLSIYR